MTFHLRSQQRPVGHEHAACGERLPPTILGEVLLQVSINAVGANRAVVRAGAAAGRGRDAKSAIQHVIVNGFRPPAVTAAAGKQFLVAGPAVVFVVHDAVGERVVMDQLDRVQLAAGQPHRQIPSIRRARDNPRTSLASVTHHRQRRLLLWIVSATLEWRSRVNEKQFAAERFD